MSKVIILPLTEVVNIVFFDPKISLIQILIHLLVQLINHASNICESPIMCLALNKKHDPDY